MTSTQQCLPIYSRDVLARIRSGDAELGGDDTAGRGGAHQTARTPRGTRRSSGIPKPPDGAAARSFPHDGAGRPARAIFLPLCYFHSTFFGDPPSKGSEGRNRMTRQPHLDLSRRERQIIDILYTNGRATAAEVQALLPDPPSYSAVRAMLRILEDKGHVRHDAGRPALSLRARRWRATTPSGPRCGTCCRPFSTDPPNRPFPRCSTIRPRAFRTTSWTAWRA